MCTFFFWLDALCVPMGEGRKTFYKIGIFFLIFYTLLHDLLEVKTIFFAQLVKRLPLSERCHIVKFYDFIWNFVL